MTNNVRISKCCSLISLKTTLNKGWTNSNHVSVINKRRETRVTQTGIYITSHVFVRVIGEVRATIVRTVYVLTSLNTSLTFNDKIVNVV